MKSLLFFLCLFCGSLFSLGQNTNLLDAHNGFKNFKLESSLENFKGTLKYSSEKKGVKSYVYLFPSTITFQKSNPKAAFLDFYDNILYDIMLYFDDYEGMSYERIIGELKILFGEPTEVKTTLTGNIWVAWEGKKVKLFTQYFVNDDNFCIEFRSINVERRFLSNEF